MRASFTLKKSARRIWALALLAVALTAGSLVGYCVHVSNVKPEGNPEFVELDIHRGITAAQLIEELEAKGLVPNTWVARYVIRSQDVFETLKAGKYRLRGDLSLVEIAEALKEGPNILAQRPITIRPGESLYEVAERVEAIKLGTSDHFLDQASNFPRAKQLSKGLLAKERQPRSDGQPWTYLEGLLAADTYHLGGDTTQAEFVEMSVARFHQIWAGLRKDRPKQTQARQSLLGLGDYELLILASLVEEEIAVESEAPRVAGVFYNRLEKSMYLKTDPAAMYRKDRVGQKPMPAHIRDAKNPFNTYTRRGLPPGPICAPGVPSLKAAMDPEDHDFLFFVARRDGSGMHAFAKTARGHMANIRKYLRKTREKRKRSER